MFRPELYHGKTPWNRFEGWYFKIVNKDATEAFAFIPGVFWGNHPQESHSFLQVLEGKTVKYNYHRFSPEVFHATTQSSLRIQVEKNHFSLEGMSLSIDSPQQKVQGSLKFSNRVDWRDKPYSPGSMGYFNFIPFLQCYSHVWAMDMDLSGDLIINGKTYNFDGGKGYGEKNWGNAFPYSWIWIQSNHFSSPTTSLSCSIGHIPLWLTSFRGFLIGLYHESTLYEFTTMKGTKMTINKQGNDVEIILKNKKHGLRIITSSEPDSYILCNGPRDGKMVPLVEESLRSKVFIRLWEEPSGKILLEDWGRACGIEYGGEQMRILN